MSNRVTNLDVCDEELARKLRRCREKLEAEERERRLRARLSRWLHGVAGSVQDEEAS